MWPEYFSLSANLFSLLITYYYFHKQAKRNFIRRHALSYLDPSLARFDATMCPPISAKPSSILAWNVRRWPFLPAPVFVGVDCARRGWGASPEAHRTQPSSSPIGTNCTFFEIMIQNYF